MNIVNSKGAVQATDEFAFTTFGLHDVGAARGDGEYDLVVQPYGHYNQSPCLGAVKTHVFFHKKMAVVTDVKLIGFGYHFNIADAMGLPQFCENCSSIFSPAHDRAFLGILPIVQGDSDGGWCAYKITQVGNGNSDSSETVQKNHDPAPRYPDLYSPGAKPPFWNMYNDDVNTSTVTITPFADDLLIPPYVANGKITKSITFYKDPSKPKVTK